VAFWISGCDTTVTTGCVTVGWHVVKPSAYTVRIGSPQKNSERVADPDTKSLCDYAAIGDRKQNTYLFAL